MPSAEAASLISGTAGGIAQVLVGHPFDTIKTQPVGALECLRDTLRSEGLCGFYRGVASSAIGIGVCNAVLFGTYTEARALLDAHSLGGEMLAGAAGGAAMAFINCPVELLKVRMQSQDPLRRQYRGVLDCAVRTVRRDGFCNGLYRGIGITLLRDTPSFATYFAVYAALRSDGNTGPLWTLASGGLAGACAWLPCYPQDVLKSRIQSASGSATLAQALAALRLQYGLWRGLWRGFPVCLLRAFPANAATFAAYELTRDFLEHRRAM